MRRKPIGMLIAGVAAGLLLSLGAEAHASLIAHDDFESYSAGSGLAGGDGGDGWTSPWSADSATTVEQKTLNDPNSQVGGGTLAARLLNESDDEMMTRLFAPASASAVYMGVLVRIEGDDADFIQLQLSDSTTGNASDTMSIGFDNGAFLARLGRHDDESATGGAAALETDYLLVGKFSKHEGSATFNRVDLFVNPDTANEGDHAPLLTALDHDTGLEQLSRFTVRTARFGGNALFLDELRIAASFAAVVPEPASLSLLGLGGLLLMRRRR